MSHIYIQSQGFGIFDVGQVITIITKALHRFFSGQIAPLDSQDYLTYSHRKGMLLSMWPPRLTIWLKPTCLRAFLEALQVRVPIWRVERALQDPYVRKCTWLKTNNKTKRNRPKASSNRSDSRRQVRRKRLTYKAPSADHQKVGPIRGYSSSH